MEFTQRNSNKAHEWSFNSFDRLPETGIYVLWNLTDSGNGLSSLRVITGNEYLKNESLVRQHRYWARVRKCSTDSGYDIGSELYVKQHGVTAFLQSIVDHAINEPESLEPELFRVLTLDLLRTGLEFRWAMQLQEDIENVLRFNPSRLGLSKEQSVEMLSRSSVASHD